MKDLGYGKAYRYAHDDPSHFIAQEYLPDELRGTMFYEPGSMGHEKRIAERMAWWRARAEGTQEPGGGGDGDLNFPRPRLYSGRSTTHDERPADHPYLDRRPRPG